MYGAVRAEVPRLRGLLGDSDPPVRAAAYRWVWFQEEAVGGIMRNPLISSHELCIGQFRSQSATRFPERTFVEHSMDERSGSGQSREHAWQV